MLLDDYLPGVRRANELCHPHRRVSGEGLCKPVDR